MDTPALDINVPVTRAGVQRPALQPLESQAACGVAGAGTATHVDLCVRNRRVQLIRPLLVTRVRARCSGYWRLRGRTGRGEASGSRVCCAHGACGAKIVIVIVIDLYLATVLHFYLAPLQLVLVPV